MPKKVPENEATPENEAAPSLSALIQTARSEAAKTTGGTVRQVVARLARGDGSATVATLTSEGFPEPALVAAVTTDHPKDGRFKARAKLGIVAGEPMIWLTTTGWQSAGRASGKERAPTAESAGHAAAPGQINTWLRKVLEPWDGLDVRAVTGEPCRAFSDQVKALAWARIQGAGDTTGGAGSLTGGLVPDALIVERFPDAATYLGAWGHDPATQDDIAEQTLALEIEDTRKASEPLRWKVERWEAATELKMVVRVVWVVRTASIRDRLFALGVGTKRRPNQLLVAGGRIGLPGSELVAASGQEWWPVRIYEQQRRSALVDAA